MAALQRLRQKGCELEASLGYVVKPSLKKCFPCALVVVGVSGLQKIWDSLVMTE